MTIDNMYAYWYGLLETGRRRKERKKKMKKKKSQKEEMTWRNMDKNCSKTVNNL